jgi:hypothetical protein
MEKVIPVDNLVLMPYEVVTLGGGILDVDEQVMVVAISADEFRNAPAISVDADITDVTWETEARDYWSGYVTIERSVNRVYGSSDRSG